MITVQWQFINRQGKVVGKPSRVHALAFPNVPGNYETMCDRKPPAKPWAGEKVVLAVGNGEITCDACCRYVYGESYAVHDSAEEQQGV